VEREILVAGAEGQSELAGAGRAGDLEGGELPRAGRQLDPLRVERGIVADARGELKLPVERRTVVGDDGPNGEPAARLAQAVKPGPRLR
jgi:hypothetical protein